KQNRLQRIMVLSQQEEMMNEILDVSEDQRGQLVNGEELAGVVSLTNNQLNAYNLFFCDVIVLSECFQIKEEFNISGFTTFYGEGNYNRNDGVIIFVKSGIHVEVVMSNCLPREPQSVECLSNLII
ncbi:hypothetical protein HHI36_018359, partial [Cryptolaemus montrouzieri]